ncbi:MAG TPA: hypothetical protein VHC47_06860 [Mucilaginibacter sp.]|nr:hypothetical protein [Mucilaginibacter sp.]
MKRKDTKGLRSTELSWPKKLLLAALIAILIGMLVFAGIKVYE